MLHSKSHGSEMFMRKSVDGEFGVFRVELHKSRRTLSVSNLC